MLDEEPFRSGLPKHQLSTHNEPLMYEILLCDGTTTLATVDTSTRSKPEGLKWKSIPGKHNISTQMVAGWRIPTINSPIEGRFYRAIQQGEGKWTIWNPNAEIEDTVDGYNEARRVVSRLDRREWSKIGRLESLAGRNFTNREIINHHNGNPNYNPGVIYYCLPTSAHH
jgi:hypothetical protein